jgi:Flp pilus assembly protein TadG
MKSPTERTPVTNPNRRKIDLRPQQGQAMTEFALVLPVLALLLFAVIQFGIVFNNYVTLTDATRAGARKAAVGRQIPNPQGATVTAVRNSASDLTQSKLSVTVTSTWQPGSDVAVTATYPYSISLLGMVVKSGSLSSTTTERVE